jgi:phosphatidate phosphatase APP1
METSTKELLNKKVRLVDKIKKQILEWIRLTNDPVVKVYNGYGNQTKMVVFGHVLSVSPLPRKKYRKNFWTNTLYLLRSFMVRPKSAALVRTNWQGKEYEVTSAKDGFFRFEFDAGEKLEAGEHEIEVELLDVDDDDDTANVLAKGKGCILIPHTTQYVFISDIDDTFLVSHSSNLRKRLYVLLTKNAHSRKPFEGVVNHYRLLARAEAKDGVLNPFFFVSSSEWNLYDFIVEFSKTNSLPKGVFLLNQIKQLSQVWKTGQNNHSTKFMRIARIIEAYPDQKYILLGDDSQQDPNIYSALVEYFPGKIRSVYLRHVYEKNVVNVQKLKEKIEAAGVPCCHFKHSAEAIEHSINIGLL